MRKPNLLVVFADQWRNSATGIHNPEIITPNIDRFAAESFYTDQAVSGCPLCSPYRSELLTGRHVSHTGVYGNCMTGYEDIRLSEDELCISQILKEQGYATGYIGKWHLDSPDQNQREMPVSGLEGWDAYTPPGPKRHGFDYWHAYNACNNHLHEHYWENSPEMIYADSWSPIHETDKAIEFMNSKKKQPFALFVSWNPPHPPFEQVPEKYCDFYKEKSLTFLPNVAGEVFDNQTGETGLKDQEELLEAMRQYYAAITGLDEQFGRIIAYLKEKDLYDNTIVLLTADHGEHFGAHGYVGKHTWYEESINVPFFLSYPQKIPSGQNDISLETVDIMPTLLGLMDVSIPRTAEGRDLSNYLIRKEKPKDEAVYSSAYISRSVFIEAYKESGIDPQKSGWRCIRTPEYKYVIEKGYFPDTVPKFWLFDRKKDLWEMNPIVTYSPEANFHMKVLHKKLMKHLKEIDDEIYVP